MDLDLNDRVFIVADGDSGLGVPTAECLVAEGARVVLSGRDGDSLEAATAALGTSAAMPVVTEAADPAVPERLVAAALSRWARLDGALICVGHVPGGSVRDVTDEQWTAAFQSVFLDAVRLSRHVAQKLSSGGSLALVLTPSVHEPVPELAVANGFQRGLASLALQLAEELGPRGIRVNALVPGPVETQPTLVPGLPAAHPSPGNATPTDEISIRRSGEAPEFGRVATFVLSPAASYISGSMIPVDGVMQRSI